MSRPRILKAADNAAAARWGRVRDEMMRRVHLVKSRYCAHRGGHDWTDWGYHNQERMDGSFYTIKSRWCIRCGIDERQQEPTP